MRYPPQLVAAGFMCLLLGIGWLLNFALNVVPAFGTLVPEGRCHYSDEQLQHNAYMLALYFVCALITRLCTFVPEIALRVGRMQQDQDVGVVGMYFLHMLLHGPQYIFVIGSLLFWAQLAQSPSCEWEHPQFYTSLRLHATFSFCVSLAWLAFAYWQGRVINEALREQRCAKRRAPPGTVDKLLTCTYDPAVFGSEEGKRFPAECPICLCEWEAKDSIKITACAHAYHEECLAGWLRRERTCAICRSDVAEGASAAPKPPLSPPDLDPPRETSPSGTESMVATSDQEPVQGNTVIAL